MTAVVLRGDARRLPLPDGCVDLIVTSPPYFGLRSYTDGGAHYPGQIGSEATPAEWLAALVECTREWVRVLKPEGSLFVNLGDKYCAGTSGSVNRTRSRTWMKENGKGLSDQDRRLSAAEAGVREKSLLGLPWRYALACTQQLGLILRRDIIWSKPNGLPESVTDRCRSSHEYVFHLVRQPRYFSAVDEIREQYAPGTSQRYAAGYNERAIDGKRLSIGTKLGGDTYGENPLGKLPGSVWRIQDDSPDVWNIPSQPLTVPPALGVDHFAAFPMELPRRIILGWSPGGVCTGCGQGRRPVTERANRPLQRVYNGTLTRVPGVGRQDYRLGVPQVTEATITGYACACAQPDAPTRPSVILDPFGGTGTTALVASALGRHGITVDMSADYCRLARWRLNDPAERARALEVPKPPVVPDDQLELFA